MAGFSVDVLMPLFPVGAAGFWVRDSLGRERAGERITAREDSREGNAGEAMGGTALQGTHEREERRREERNRTRETPDSIYSWEPERLPLPSTALVL